MATIGVFQTLLTRKVGVSHPILLAPMLGTSGGRLAGSVAQAGGVGIIAVGYYNAPAGNSPEWVSQQYAIAQSIVERKKDGLKGAVGFGFMGSFMNNKEKDLSFLKALELKPKVIWLAFLDTLTPFVSAVHKAGAFLIAMAHSITEAQKFADEGADIIVLQGSDAGGHGKQYYGTSIVSLIPEAKEAISRDIPIVAAGGIVDGRGIAASLALGADGVVMGTRFLASKEALTSPLIHEKLIKTKDAASNTLVTAAVDCLNDIPYWGRDITGRTIHDYPELLKHHTKCVPGFIKFTATTQEKEHFISYQKDVSPNAWAGSAVGLIKSIEDAGFIVHSSVDSARKILTVQMRDVIVTSKL